MSNQSEVLTNQAIKEELEKIRMEFEDFTGGPESITETLTLKLPVAVILMLENMAYELRRDEQLQHIENLTKQRLCVLLLDAILVDYKKACINNLTKGLIEYLNEYYEHVGLKLT